MTPEVIDSHARPPSSLRVLFKERQKCSSEYLTNHQDILDTVALDRSSAVDEVLISHASLAKIGEGIERFNSGSSVLQQISDARCFEIKSLPGLFIYPSFIPQCVQMELLNRLLHRDLGDPAHKTNLHLHYDTEDFVSAQSAMLNISSRPSYFNMSPEVALQPKDATVHRPLTLQQILEKKLRWVTLGGQYDWSAKVYPDEIPPAFPEDIAELLRAFFPGVDPQAAILNFYSPGDSLSLHRDVSEECDRGLISISIGCEALFIVANADGSSHVTIRLRSGDVVMMSGPSRYAWHAVPKVLPNTCPSELRNWPMQEPDLSLISWRGWLANKRINLNVRQMKA